jgi:hypothetical protein
MILIILALFWVAVLAPIVVRRLRDSGTEKSIEHFHTEHEVLSRQEYTVPPAHRLDRSDQEEVHSQYESRRPRLTVVHDDDTYGSLEARGSWNEWSEDYEFDESAASRREPTRNRYAAAYSSTPREPMTRSTYEPPIVRQRSMRVRRRVVFTRLVLAAVVISAVGFFAGYSLIIDLAVVSWIAVAGFVALALYAVSLGYLNESSLPLRLPQRRSLATVQPLYGETTDAYDEQYEDEYDEFYEPENDVRWRHESQSRRALG